MNKNASKIFLCLSIVPVFLYAGSSTTFASNAYECKSTTLIELYTNECEECPACPPAEACQAGFSCQPNEIINPITTPGECASFLAEYRNPEQHKLPANRVYPMGQKMMLTAWLGKSAGDLEKMKQHGFTMQGPEWNTMNLNYLDTAISKGLRSAHRIIDGPTNAHELKKVYKDGKQEAMFRNLRSRVRKITQVPKYNNNVDIWLTGVEELSTHIGDGDWDVTLAVATDYLKRLKQIVKEEDPQQRPLWMSDVTGVQQSKMLVTQQYLDMLGPQVYLGRINPVGRGYTTDAVMGSIARTIVSTAQELDSRYPGKYKRASTASLDALYEPISSRDGAENISRIVEHWMYLGFNNGLQGYQFYAWNNYTGGAYADTQTWNWWRYAYYKHVKRLTDNKLDYAYLWGDRRSDLDMKIVSGPATTHGYPSISMQNIQYGKDRFVVLTNSADSAVQVEVSGFPKNCVKTLDIRTGKDLPNNGAVSLILQPLDVRLFRFFSVTR